MMQVTNLSRRISNFISTALSKHKQCAKLVAPIFIIKSITIRRNMTTSVYGSWKSPISSQLVTTSGVGLQEVRVDANTELTDEVYWTELRYEEKGRYVVCSANRQTGEIQEWTPKDFNARTTVHEYGGGDFFVFNGAIYFSNFSDQVLYVQRSPSAAPEPVTETSKKWRYADGVYSPVTKLIYSVREDHEVIKEGAKEPANTIVAINPDTKTQSVLASGADFYSHPRVTTDGKHICWVQWYHPNMPWDTTEVWVAEMNDLGNAIVEGSQRKVAGGGDTSVVEPGWTNIGQLLYVGDQTDWWNLYMVTPDGKHTNLHEVASEIAGPQWTFGKTAYVVDPQGSNRILTLHNSELGVLDWKTRDYKKLETGFRSNKCLTWTATGDAYFIGSSETQFPCIVRYNTNTGEISIIKESNPVPVDRGYLSLPQNISWPTGEQETAHGIFYPPQNKDFQAPPGTLPPLLVRAHGGPTAQYSSTLDLKLQYFTSRGFAVLLVNYRGSTGFSKKYRHRLRKMWGVCDVEDCCSGVEYLVAGKKVDPDKICIDGGSAGGYTTLACLTFRKTFKAGASHYGIGDLEALMKDTHKFESRYLDTLLCPLDDAGRELLHKRSPIYHTQHLSCPIALFQGDQDKIVPPNQAEMMYKAVKEKGIPCMYVLFEGEQHGFRKSENIQLALDGEFYFFGKVLGFEPADRGVDIKIDNLN